MSTSQSFGPGSGRAAQDTAGGAPPRPVKPADVVVDPDTPLVEWIDAVLASCLEHLRGNRDAARSIEDPEGVHQLRVAARRTRSVLRLLRPYVAPTPTRRLRDELRWIGGALGPARDYDVFCLETLAEIRTALPDAPGLRRLCWEAELQRLGGHEAARAAVDSERFDFDVLLFDRYVRGGEWRPDPGSKRARRIRRPARRAGARLLDGLFREVRLLDRPFAQLSGEDLHALRIRVKRLRYAAELFAPLYAQPARALPSSERRREGKREKKRERSERAARRFVRRLRSLQDALGRTNDGRVADALVGDLLARVDPATRVRLAHAAGVVSGWAHARARHERPRLEQAWQRVAVAPPFWR